MSLAAIGMARVAEETRAWDWLALSMSSVLDRLLREGGLQSTSSPVASIAYHLAQCPSLVMGALSDSARSALSLPTEELRSLAFAPLAAARP
jgi:hypothetical protein